MVPSRAQAAAEAIASLRLEGLTADSAALERLDAWARHELSDEDLAADEDRILADARARSHASAAA
jgi:hypothetical protein